MKRVFSFLLLAACFGITASANVLHVPGEYTTIQDAIDASVNGDTVRVAPGTYWGRVNFVGKRILLESTAGPDSTVITAQSDSTPLVRFYSGEDSSAILRGFTIRGSSGIGVTVLYSGPIIESNIIEDNSNYGTYSPNHDGGGIYANQATCIIRNNVIRNNYSPGAGGAISISNSSGIKIFGNRVISNDCGTLGGGIFIISCDNCLIQGNLIAANHSVAGGGGLWFTLGSNNRIINNTIDSNYCDSGNYGSGVMILNSDYNFLQNNIITGNYPGGGIVKRWGIPLSDTLIYSDLFGNLPSDYDSVFFGPGCISSDPLFVDKPNGDYNLLVSSPCVDAGDPTSPPDLDGTIADMGAFPLYHRTLFYISTTGNDTTGYGSEANPFRTIQHGIDISLDGDTVLVNDGHYFERINFRGKGIIVASRHLFDDDTLHIQNTAIDGDTLVLGLADTGSVVCFVGGEDSSSVLWGLTIQNGIGTINNSERKGGGIYFDIGNFNYGPIITDCVIINNSNYGIYCDPSSSMSLRYTEISDNQDGGGIYALSGELGGGYISVNNCIIHGNMGPALLSSNVDSPLRSLRFENSIISDNGDGIHQYKNADYFNCRFENNDGYLLVDEEKSIAGKRPITEEISSYSDSIVGCTFRGNGSGVYVRDSNDIFCQNDSFIDNRSSAIIRSGDGWLRVVDSYFANNTGSSGGAIRGYYGGLQNTYIDNCKFISNVADQGGGAINFGGNSSGEPDQISRCIFSGNRAHQGGAIFDEEPQEKIFSSCTFINNYADTGAALYLRTRYAYRQQLDSCLIVFNGPGDAVYSYCSDSVIISCTDIYGNPGGGWVGCIDSFANINGNFSADPLFCDTTNNDFHISSASPCAPSGNSCNSLIGAVGIGCQPDAVFHLLQPLPDTVYPDQPANFVWSRASDLIYGDSTTYRLYLANNSEFALPESSEVISDTTYSLSGELDRSQNYYWKVAAIAFHSPLRLSMEIWNFYLDGFPSGPEILDPPNGIHADLETYLIWNVSSDPDSFDAVSYSVQIDDDSSFISPEIEQSGLRSGMMVEDAFAIRLGDLGDSDSLDIDTRYFWRLRADDNYGLSSDWTDGNNWFIFMALNHPPDAPISGFSPSGGEEVISLTPTITWNDAFDLDPDDNGDNLSYVVRLSLDSIFEESVYSDTTAPGINQIVPSFELDDNSHYFYEVMTTDEDGLSSDWSIRQDFWTNHYNFPPEPFLVYGPGDGDRRVDYYTQFYWGSTIDYDPNSSFSYSLRISADSGFNSIQWQLTGMSDTSLVIPTDSLTPGGGHLYWKVMAIDDDGLIRIGGIPEGIRELIVLPPGDANGSGVTNGLDVTFMVSYLKGTGPAPDPISAGDANGNCQTNGMDVVYLVSYLKGSDLVPVRPDCGPIIAGENNGKPREEQ